MNDIDRDVIGGYLTTARFVGARTEWAEGYWVGRAIEYANQNAVDNDWLRDELGQHGFDAALIAESKPDHRGQG